MDLFKVIIDIMDLFKVIIHIMDLFKVIINTMDLFRFIIDIMVITVIFNFIITFTNFNFKAFKFDFITISSNFEVLNFKLKSANSITIFKNSN